MSAEVIKRHEGFKSEKETIGENSRVQISYNSDGRIVIRYIESSEEDTLIVLDNRETNELMRFIQKLNEIHKIYEEMPF